MKTVDARGQKCPMPLILTKRALLEAAPDEQLEILIDNEISVKNVSRFLSEHQMIFTVRQEQDLFRMTVGKTGQITEQAAVEEFCEVPGSNPAGYVVCVQKDIMSDGPEAFGTRLVYLFINTLPDVDRKPETMVFINSSVFLALKDSPVLESLKKLESAGVRMLVCGTCLEFFQKKDELAVGLVSNMYEILTTMAAAPKVLYP